MHSRRTGKRARTFLSIIAVLALNAGIIVPATVLAANPSANLDQCANDQAPSPNSDGCNVSGTQWVNGNLGASKSVYSEGDSIPYRLTFANLSLASHTVVIEWDTTKSGKHALDYITTWNRSVLNANPCLGITGCSAPGHTFPIPKDPQVDNGSGSPITQAAGNFTLFGGTITGVSAYSYPNGAGFAGDKSARIAVTFTASRANPVLAWGGHIATRLDWGTTASAVAISGSPYHTRLVNLDGSGGNQDRSLSADAVVFPGSITIIKQASPEGATSFAFTASPSPLTGFSLVDNGTSANTKVFPITAAADFKAYTVAETVPAGWDLTNRVCSISSPNGGTAGASGASGVAINLKEGENVTCTFSNTAQNPVLSITKVATESGYDSVGDVINYTITATNDGNVTLANVTVTDPGVSNLVCTPANGSSLAPGASMTCTASHTITQADIDAGSYFNQSCVDDGAGGATEVCDDVTTPGDQDPSLTITKVDTEENYDSVGDVIHYTITATNDGNVTLAAVTVTDPNVSDLVCDPANGSSLAPGASLNCTASHTVTQADIDAGSFFNEACVDDGVGGAAEDCDDATTPSDKNPLLSITKDATETGFDSVGDVINYTIIATNDGNTTLSNVTVTDAQVTDLVCVPASGSALAPGESMTCTASHTITQADIDAGEFFNEACVDDGNGALPDCDDVTTPGDQNPSLTITKVATESGYDSVGDVIHYTITASNDGNVTLSDVTVTDTQVSDLDCTPSIPVASLAPGASITCTASHTITQADIDGGSFFNQACVDDGTGEASEACDDVTTPADQDDNLGLTKTDDLNPDRYEDEGEVVTFTITATNNGNTTLHNVTVSDAPALDDFSCTPSIPVASLAPGESIECTGTHTITKDDLNAGFFTDIASASSDEDDAPDADDTIYGKAQPSVVTTDTFIPQDSIVLSGLTADATGDLYVELRINETCAQDPTPAYSKTWSGPISNTTPYVTDNTVAVGTDATIRWCVSYSGDPNNANIPLGSHGEISSIDFDPIGVLGFGAGAIPMLAWALWNRRRRDEAN